MSYSFLRFLHSSLHTPPYVLPECTTMVILFLSSQIHHNCPMPAESPGALDLPFQALYSQPNSCLETHILIHMPLEATDSHLSMCMSIPGPCACSFLSLQFLLKFPSLLAQIHCKTVPDSSNQGGPTAFYIFSYTQENLCYTYCFFILST